MKECIFILQHMCKQADSHIKHDKVLDWKANYLSGELREPESAGEAS